VQYTWRKLVGSNSRVLAFLSIALVGGMAAMKMRPQRPRTENVILVTLDGFRWQELFGGADSLLMGNRRYASDTAALRREFWARSAEQRRERLLPFTWSTIARQGQIYGDRSAGSRVNVTNRHRFSYPGYNEILVGRADPRIDSNDKRPNPNRTVLEVVHEQKDFRGKVAAFASWDVFPFILNEQRSGFPVNAGFESADGRELSARESFLNELQPQVHSPWSNVRLDAFTHNYALAYLKRKRPRLLYIAYGETDDFAHDQKYHFYLQAARRTDAFLRDLWTWIQADSEYRNRTTMIVTTDHGRGLGDRWSDHGADVVGADEIWLLVLGPDTEPGRPSDRAGQFYQNQVASTVAALLSVRYRPDPAAGPVLEPVLNRGR
jgi:hypothetical protein